MNEKERQKLQGEVREEHSDMECAKIIPIKLPCWKYEAHILYSARPDLSTLDRTFIRLIKSRVNTKEELASALGVGEHEFIFQNLDALAHRGYVESYDKKIYNLTERGNHLYDDSDGKREIKEWEKYGMIWDYSSEKLSRWFHELDKKHNRYLKTELPVKLLKHPQRPSESELEEKLSDYFNFHLGNQDKAFYDVLPIEHERRKFRSQKAYWKQEFAALFYVAKGRDASDEIKHIEIRQRIDSKRPEFELRDDLTQIIKSQKIPEWNEQLEDFYSKEPKLQ